MGSITPPPTIVPRPTPSVPASPAAATPTVPATPIATPATTSLPPRPARDVSQVPTTPAAGVQGAGEPGAATIMPTAGAGDSYAVTAQTTPDQLAAFVTGSDKPTVVTTDAGQTFVVSGIQPDGHGSYTVSTINPQNDGAAGDLPAALLLKNVASLEHLSFPSAKALRSDGPSADNPNALPAGDYQLAGIVADPKSGTLQAKLTGGTNPTVSWQDFKTSFGGWQGAQDSINGSLPPATLGRILAGDTQAARKTHVSADATGISPGDATNDVSDADFGKWLDRHASTPVVAQRRGDQGFDLVSRDANNFYRVTDLSTGQTRATGLDLTAIRDGYSFLQSPGPAAGTILWDGSGDPPAQARVDAVGLASDGTPTVTLTPWEGGITGKPTAGGAAETLTLPDFHARFGADGGSGLAAGALSTPEASGKQPTWVRGTGTEGTGNIFGSNGIDNVRQGSVNDCYFNVALAALQKAQPDALQNLIKPAANGQPGQYDVTLYRPSPNGPTPYVVTVDDRVPMRVDDQGKNAGSTGLGVDISEGGKRIDNAAPALIEKAFAVMNQSLHNHGPGVGYAGIGFGSAADAMTMLTGGRATDTNISGANPESVWQDLAGATQNGMAAAVTKAPGTPVGNFGPGLEASHEYTVLAVSGEGDQRMVTLRNPAGFKTDPASAADSPTGTPLEGNQFTISYADFLKNFAMYTVGEIGRRG